MNVPYLDIGCGPDKKDGWFGIDIHNYQDIYGDEFLQWDLECGKLPFGTGSIKGIRAMHVFEHIHNFIPLLNDCHRVLDPSDGYLELEVPRAGSEASFKDPTHVRFFAMKTFTYFEKGKRQINYDIAPWTMEHDSPRLTGGNNDKIYCKMFPDEWDEWEVLDSNNDVVKL